MRGRSALAFRKKYCLRLRASALGTFEHADKAAPRELVFEERTIEHATSQSPNLHFDAEILNIRAAIIPRTPH